MELFSPKTEEKILDFWKREQIFEKSLKNRAKAKPFIFFEGPPSANGQPGIHHVLSRVYKDIICRYKTMAGFYVPRRAGWDTHGLPVEIQVEKELGFKNKKEIEKYGVGRFNQKAQEIVWKYKEEWDKLTERIGFWLDLKDPYITYEPHYIESLWYLIAQIAKKKLLYQDFKVVPYCPRCGTALSSHEVALGYKKVSEDSVYIKFKLKNSENTFILSWTTTPWTLPGNVALAVGRDIKYDFVRVEDEILIVAQNLRKNVLGETSGEILKTVSGKDLVGLSYNPLFNIRQLKNEKSYKIYDADFVSIEEGTGVVHTAVMYGEDDFNLGKKVGLPKFHTVDLEGKFIKGLGAGLDGLLVKSIEASAKILNLLKEKNRLFQILKYEHDYPFCWRCESPLLYYAKSSWFIKMENLRAKLIANNKKINWVPAHVKNGRFGEWLNEAKDWAFSRERYWGAPLPIWSCKKCKNNHAVGSLAELDKLSSKKLNHYIFLRHGEAENNREHIVSSWPEKKKFLLTVKGAREIEALIPWFKKQKIDFVFSSDLLRTKETAQIIAGALDKKIVYDKRLREHNFGVYNGHSADKWSELFNNESDKYFVKPAGGENLSDVKKRMTDFLKVADKRYQGKNILIVSHANPILSATGAYQGYKDEEVAQFKRTFKIDGKTGAVFEMSGHNWPYNGDGDLDMHRPYVDNLNLKCSKCGGKMARVKEVIDVWFDSGAMPFASVHWPFNKKLEYPADFIVEGVDQTRGWFYTLHAVGALLDKGPAYKNVISLGHVLDEKGEKMSKSRGNIVDPWGVINKYGIDALRWYFFTINPPGEPKRFNIRDVEDKLRKFVLILSNVLIFYKTYVTTKSDLKNPRSRASIGLLDKWILSRLNQTIKVVKTNLDQYEVTGGARPIDGFIDDLSRWWLRRSRNRFSERNAEIPSAVLRLVMEELSKLIAPFTPFLAEYIWHNVGNKESIHLQDYPKAQKKMINEKLEEQMNWVREIATKGLALRADAGIKVRQPLQKLKINPSTNGEKLKILDKELLELIKEEVNVKKIIFDDKIENEFELDTKITAELKEEGLTRELARQIQGMRKDGGLTPKEAIVVYMKGEENIQKVISKWEKTLVSEVGARKIEFVGVIKDGLLIDRHFKVENKDIWIGIAKISINL
ncbi:MAG: class I tRNA ligase family protein [Candidatus Azambacteria bacterium]|nr:class I tRNA ligase family protein [Candidatus Azambacteria bacterium]